MPESAVVCEHDREVPAGNFLFPTPESPPQDCAGGDPFDREGWGELLFVDVANKEAGRARGARMP